MTHMRLGLGIGPGLHPMLHGSNDEVGLESVDIEMAGDAQQLEPLGISQDGAVEALNDQRCKTSSGAFVGFRDSGFSGAEALQ